MLKYEIAGIQFALIPDDADYFHFDSKYLRNLNFFFSDSKEKLDINISLHGCDFIPHPQGELLFDEEIKWIHIPQKSNKTCVYICSQISGMIEALLETGHDYSNCTIYYLKNLPNCGYAVTGPLLEIFFRNYLLQQKGLVIHSSAIVYKGAGILFSGPSGAGKSTQAKLWNKHLGAEIINEDRPAIRIRDSQLHVYGTPWSGSSSRFLNKSAPLSMIVMLEQSDENSLRQLTSPEAARYITPRCFLPYHDEGLMDIALNTLGSIISSTPVYLLQCKPDKEAVELVYQCMK